MRDGRCVPRRADHVPADPTDRREQQEDGEQEQRERRDEARPFAHDVAAGKRSRVQDQQGQRTPHLALEMEHAVRDLVPDRADRPVDLAGLAARMAIGARQPRAAIEAEAAAMAVPRLARRGFEHVRTDRTRP